MKPVTRRRLKVFNEAIPSAVRAALLATDRVTPMLAGASCIRQGTDEGLLLVRTPEAELEVAASNALLDRVFTLCDGTQTIDELLARIAAPREREEFASFMDFLFEQGALIDAGQACAQAVRYGYQYSQFGAAASPEVSDLIAPRFAWNEEAAPAALPKNAARVSGAPLDAFFKERSSVYTFNDKPVTEKALLRLLWSAAGVVHATHPRSGQLIPHRTLASAGGMYLLKVYVALRRQVGRYSPGVYRVEYPGERLVALTLVNDDVSALPLASTKPWKLTHATGVIFIAADPSIAALRYRNRSLQYLFMEAGAAFHNIALSAPALGISQATLGGYYEQVATDLCQLAPQDILLGTALFGASPTQRQLDLAQVSPSFDFGWVGAQAPNFRMNFHLAQAKIVDDHDKRQYSWGRDKDPMLAARKALAEAIEREGYCQPRDLLIGKLTDVRDALDPSRHALYTSEQYQTDGFPYVPFAADREHAWVPAQELASCRPVHVLADLVFARSALLRAGFGSDQPFTQETSSGCAAGITFEDAATRALNEVIERDAFMRHWLTQTPGQTVPSAQWPRAFQQRMAALQAAGCRVQLQRLESPWVHVAMVAVQHEEHHFTTLGASAHPDFAVAAEGALDEAETRVYGWLHQHTPSVTDPALAATPEDHFSLYGQRDYFRKADRLLFAANAGNTSAWPRRQAAGALQDVVKRLKRSGLNAYAVDITPEKHHVDQGRTELRVVRVLVPGLVPMIFGQNLLPLAAVDSVHPDAHFPHPFP
ncbi:ribosomal protein S12 methylthiotransferase accessory factor [Roseateles sp. YR242]|uniref:YcaO-like family protein n=1 Tax=Roseateles sp. YR242 TaxID=1855305 RepID=UPI0008D78EE5|nr:YcaO-like family protein [Roseateles sp. YR242]SEK92666.1 ribosomal protein S12 methylthiotransferase accessory factor [Roseateles sp. YR242]